jgi:hypothetical protein
VYCATDRSSAIDACTFSSNGNTITVTGGAIAAYTGSHKDLYATGTVFRDGSANRGAAINSDRGPVTIQTSAFSKCEAARNGGAVWSSGTTSIASSDTNFTFNTAVNSGAAVFQFGTQWPLAAISASVSFDNNSAGCCHATGYGSSSEWLSADCCNSTWF